MPIRVSILPLIRVRSCQVRTGRIIPQTLSFELCGIAYLPVQVVTTTAIYGDGNKQSPYKRSNLFRVLCVSLPIQAFASCAIYGEVNKQAWSLSFATQHCASSKAEGCFLVDTVAQSYILSNCSFSSTGMRSTNNQIFQCVKDNEPFACFGNMQETDEGIFPIHEVWMHDAFPLFLGVCQARQHSFGK